MDTWTFDMLIVNHAGKRIVYGGALPIKYCSVLKRFAVEAVPFDEVGA
jgi:hypothetical protein